MILGVSWLATLGDVKANSQNLTMDIMFGGQLVSLWSDPSLSRCEISFASLQKMTMRRSVGFFGRWTR